MAATDEITQSFIADSESSDPLVRIEAKLDLILAFINQLGDMINSVGPLVEQLSEHPMLKMFLGSLGN